MVGDFGCEVIFYQLISQINCNRAGTLKGNKEVEKTMLNAFLSS